MRETEYDVGEVPGRKAVGGDAEEVFGKRFGCQSGPFYEIVRNVSSSRGKREGSFSRFRFAGDVL